MQNTAVDELPAGHEEIEDNFPEPADEGASEENEDVVTKCVFGGVIFGCF